VVKKRATTRKKERTHNITASGENRVEKILIENFISLQKVMTNLAVKFDNLSSQISNLLELFELSAKSLAEKDSLGDKRVMDKLDTLIDQNKVFARGIALNIAKEPGPQYPSLPQLQRPVQYPVQQPINRMEYQQSPSPEFSRNQNLRR
jgi:hypothetical protein